MEVLPTHRKRMLKLMVIHDVSQRDVSTAAGWRSHSYFGRILRGEVTTLDNDAAVRIAHYFGVGVDDLFVTRSSSSAKRPVHSSGTAA